MKIEFDPLNHEEVKAVQAYLNVYHAGPVETAAAEEPKEKPKRKRRTKAEIEAAKAAEAHPDEEPKKDPVSSPDPFGNGYDVTAAKADLEKVRDHPDHGLEVVVSILKSAGITKVNDLEGNEAALTIVKTETEKRLG